MTGSEIDHAIEPLDVAELAQNVALSNSVGWPDEEADWRVLYEAGEVRGVRHGGRLIAQGVLGDYGSAATLAKMVVASDFRGRGLGGRLLDGFLASAEARGTPVGLCATELGRPLYESRGFRVTGELVILTGEPRLGTVDGAPVVELSHAGQCAEIERRVCACDRAKMLRARFREASVRLRLSDGSGFALATGQGAGSLVGPIWAGNEDDARALARAVFVLLGRPVRIDVPLEQASFRRWLVGLGLQERGIRVEMGWRSERLPWQTGARYALAAQAWG
jgi:GNAT superfamily N-acetyltransferase